MKSFLFCIGVRVGLPRFFLPPLFVRISSNTGPSVSRIFFTASASSSGSDTWKACKYVVIERNTPLVSELRPG